MMDEEMGKKKLKEKCGDDAALIYVSRCVANPTPVPLVRVDIIALPSLPPYLPPFILPFPLMRPTYLRKDVQELGDQLAASPGVLRDDVGIVENAALLKHCGLLQVLIRRDCKDGVGRERR